VGYEEEHLRRDLRNQEQLDIQGKEEDGGGEESLRTCIWQPLGLLTTVKPPALRERHDYAECVYYAAKYRFVVGSRPLTMVSRLSSDGAPAPWVGRKRVRRGMRTGLVRGRMGAAARTVSW
jgi:hypothetical protein